MRRALLLPCLLALTACPAGLRRPASTQLVVNGTVTVAGIERRGDALAGAQAVLRKAPSGEVLAENVSSATGGYRLNATVQPGDVVQLSLTADGFAPAVRRFVVGPSTELNASLAMHPLEAFACQDLACGPALDDVSWIASPPDSTGFAAPFDLAADAPVTVPPLENRPLVALAFVALDAGSFDGGAGDLGTLSLRLPFDRWPLLADAVPDSGVLEVWAQAFDVATGTWRTLPPALLSTEAGEPLPESALAALTSQQLAGGAVARLSFVGEGFIAALGAAKAEGCVEGTVQAEGSGAAGVSVQVAGSVPVSSGDTGAFCVSAPVGSALASTRLQYAGLSYAAEALPRPTAAGACGGTCTQAGVVTVLAEQEQLARACEVKGTVVDSLGRPVPDAVVVGFDANLPGNSFAALCGPSGTRCALVSPSTAQGAFRLVLPVHSGVFLAVQATRGVGTPLESTQWGSAVVTGCPTAAITVPLRRGKERLEVAATYEGTQLTWSPARAAARLVVTDALGAPKWELSSVVGLHPPITFGAVPSGAVEVLAPVGAPAAGDELAVLVTGADQSGVYEGSATTTRP